MNTIPNPEYHQPKGKRASADYPIIGEYAMIALPNVATALWGKVLRYDLAVLVIENNNGVLVIPWAAQPTILYPEGVPVSHEMAVYLNLTGADEDEDEE